MSPDLVMQGQEGDRRVDGLTRLGTQAHHLEVRAMDLLRQLVHSNVARGTHQHLPVGTTATDHSNRPLQKNVARVTHQDLPGNHSNIS